MFVRLTHQQPVFLAIGGADGPRSGPWVTPTPAPGPSDQFPSLPGPSHSQPITIDLWAHPVPSRPSVPSCSWFHFMGEERETVIWAPRGRGVSTYRFTREVPGWVLCQSSAAGAVGGRVTFRRGRGARGEAVSLLIDFVQRLQLSEGVYALELFQSLLPQRLPRGSWRPGPSLG